jgi:hypothetical protein
MRADPAPNEESVMRIGKMLQTSGTALLLAMFLATSVLAAPVAKPQEAPAPVKITAPAAAGAVASPPALQTEPAEEPPEEGGLQVHPGLKKVFDPQPEPPGAELKINPQVQPQ